MQCLKIHTVKNGKIDFLSVGEFVEECTESTIYLIDVDSHNHREMNFRVYDVLSGIFELWIDAAPRRHYDVMDVLVSGGNIAIISDYFMKEKELRASLELSENLIFKSYQLDKIEKFITWGGKRVITSRSIAPFVSVERYIMRGGEICLWKN